MLKREGYEVTTAADGEQALGVLQKTPVDVVVTDLVMPRLGGMELLRRAVGDFPDVPVIVITAHASVDSAVAALKAGAFDYITKPFEQDDLKNVIATTARALPSWASPPRSRRSTRSSGRWPTRPRPCSSPARAAPARSSSRRRSTAARPGGTSRSSR